jgi:hypothetical protein
MGLELIQSITNNYPPNSFLPLYQNLLLLKKEVDMNILEIPILGNGSIKCWNNFFKDIPNDWSGLDISYAFDPNFINQCIEKNIKFDLLLLNNSTTIETICSYIELYTPLLADKYIFVIENVPPSDVETITAKIPEHLYNYNKNYQLNINDDMVIITIDNYT